MPVMNKDTSKMLAGFSCQLFLRIEVIFLLFERVADYMTEKDSGTISQILTYCSSVLSWRLDGDAYGMKQFGNSLMRLLFSLSHLITTGEESAELETLCMELSLIFIEFEGTADDALRTLQKYVKDRSGDLDILESVMQKCYQYFLSETQLRNRRLVALRCVGFAMTAKDQNYILRTLGIILEPRMKVLQSIVEGQMATSAQNIKNLEEECLFELAVLSELIATQRPKIDLTDGSTGAEKPSSSNYHTQSTAVQKILWQCLPLLINLLRIYSSSEVLVAKVCDVLKSGLVAVQLRTTELLNAYCEVLDFILLMHPTAASGLAKTLYMVYAQETTSLKLVQKLSEWFKRIKEDTRECCEGYVILAYNVIKKYWRMLTDSPELGYDIVRTIRDITLQVCLLLKHQVATFMSQVFCL